MFCGAGPLRTRPAVSYCEPWQGQNQPPYSPLGSPTACPFGMQPRWVQMPIITSQGSRSLPARFSSVAGALSGRLALRASGSKLVERHGLGLVDLLLGAVADEDRLAAPHHGDRLALLDMGEIDLGRRHRQRRLVRVHLIEQRPQPEAETDRGKAAGGDHDHVAPRRVLFIGKGKCAGVNCVLSANSPKLLTIANGPDCFSRASRKIDHPRPPPRAGVAMLRLELMPLPCWPRLRAQHGSSCFLASASELVQDRILGKLAQCTKTFGAGSEYSPNPDLDRGQRWPYPLTSFQRPLARRPIVTGWPVTMTQAKPRETKEFASDAESLETRKERARLWFEALRDDIWRHSRRSRTTARVRYFTPDSLPDVSPARPGRGPSSGGEDGGGVMSLMSGRVFEKVGCHTSTVHGSFAPEFARRSQAPIRIHASGPRASPSSPTPRTRTRRPRI